MTAVVELAADGPGLGAIRQSASDLASLLVLSTVLSASRDEEQVLRLAATSVSAYARCEAAGVFLTQRGWTNETKLPKASRRQLEDRFGAQSQEGTRVTLPGPPQVVAFPLGGVDEDHGWLVTIGATVLTGEERFLLSVLAQQAGMALTTIGLRSQLRRSLDMRHRGEVTEALLAGRCDEAVLERAAGLGHRAEAAHWVAVLRPDHRVEVDRLLLAAHTAEDHLGGGSLVAVRPEGDLVALTDRAGAWELFHQRLQAQLGTRCRLAVGGRCTAPEQYPRSNQQALFALALHRPEQVVCFDDLGAYRLLSLAEGAAGAREYVDQHLGPLIRYDIRRRSHLVESLHHWLDCWGNYEAAAKVLGVHKSTLKYRLQRVREITGLDLRCPDVRFNLHLATRAWLALQAAG